jgi:uncharacterized membrane protein YdbT with pleckstrin-like domain
VFDAIARWLDPDVGSHLMRNHDEVIVDEVRRHWFVFVRPAVQAWVGLVLMSWGMFGVQLDLVSLVGIGLVLWACWIGARERREVFVVTNLRVFRLSGVFNTRRASMPLTRILDVTLDKPLHGRLLGFGHLTFESAAQEQGLRDIRYVARPDRREHTIQETVADVIHRHAVRGPR